MLTSRVSKAFSYGATTFNITTLSIKGLFATLSITTLFIECHYTECHISFSTMLSVLILRVVALPFLDNIRPRPNVLNFFVRNLQIFVLR
jgi:hypothetical protein